ncbi:MAG: hypothetical protein ABJ387_03480 [Balneola sp.]
MKPFRKWPIVRTILGDNSSGKKLNKALPFPKVRGVIGSVFRGVADLAPTPNNKDALIREKAEKALAIVKAVKLDKVQDSAVEALQDLHDLLDDGLINDSVELSPEARATTRLLSSYAFFGWIVYEILAVIFGWSSFLKIALFLIGGA